MKGIQVELGERSYPIYVEANSIAKIGQLARTHALGHKIALVTDTNVAGYYREEVENSLVQHDFQVLGFILPAGETTKNLKMADFLYEKLIEANFDRQSVIISVGGGVVGDLAGFVAATYLRGISFIQIPTTLLAQTDSSVGGKVGINHRLGKNLIGAFHQPGFVLIDPEVLKTLPQRELWSGMAEVIKYALIYDPDFFEFLAANLSDLILLANMDDLEQVIEHCCSIKANIVIQDEKEKGLRRILNFGHTVGHALEALTNYNFFRHGEAITLGMRAMTWLSKELNLLSASDFEKIEELLVRIPLPEALPDMIPQEVLEKIQRDKKVADGVLHLVLLNGIGKACVQSGLEPSVLVSMLEHLRKTILVKNLAHRSRRTAN
ncbi:3-dehydroquinate synthase [candidate division KSB1 bacterium]|nr:3-dehydroquinate synthase [candidate division KSB1 bacterium]